MGFMDSILKKMKLNDDEDDYDEYDESFDDEEEEPVKKRPKRAVKRNDFRDDDMDLDDEDDSPYANSGRASQPAPERPQSTYRQPQPKVIQTPRTVGTANGPEVCMIVPKNFDDANTIADVLLKNKAVILNLEGIDMAAAQRIIDFASGSCYTVGGNLQKISKKIFMIVPESMNLSGDFDQLIGDMIDLNSVNILK
jgi:cell division inhibitor SepF